MCFFINVHECVWVCEWPWLCFYSVFHSQEPIRPPWLFKNEIFIFSLKTNVPCPEGLLYELQENMSSNCSKMDLDGRDSPFRHFHRCSRITGSHWEGDDPQFVVMCVVLGRSGLESSRGWDSSDTRGHCLPGWRDGANCCQHIRLKLTSVVEKKKNRWCWHCLGEFV